MFRRQEAIGVSGPCIPCIDCKKPVVTVATDGHHKFYQCGKCYAKSKAGAMNFTLVYEI